MCEARHAQALVGNMQGRAVQVGGNLVATDIGHDLHAQRARRPKNARGAWGGRPLELP